MHGLYTEVLVRWMERIADGQPPLIFGDGLQTMDFVYTTDIARANMLAAASDVVEGVYNIASGRRRACWSWPRRCCGRWAPTCGVEHGPERAVNGVTRRLASTEAASRDLGFTAEVGLDEGLRDLVAWWQAERALDQTETRLVGAAP